MDQAAKHPMSFTFDESTDEGNKWRRSVAESLGTTVDLAKLNTGNNERYTSHVKGMVAMREALSGMGEEDFDSLKQMVKHSFPDLLSALQPTRYRPKIEVTKHGKSLVLRAITALFSVKPGCE